jgi:rare lipoprotein A
VVVRINDRGPFIGDRVIDLSYTAAHKLGVLAGGSAIVEVESILPGDPAPARTASAATAPPAPSAPEPTPRVAAAELAPVAVALPPVQAQPTTAAATPPEAEPQAAASGIYVQFGAFRSRENAETYLARLKLQIEWLASALRVLQRGGLYRVHAGPYSSQGEAQQIANRIGDSLGPKPIVLKW